MPSIIKAQNSNLNMSGSASASPVDAPFPLNAGHISAESSIPSPSVSSAKFRLEAEIRMR